MGRDAPEAVDAVRCLEQAPSASPLPRPSPTRLRARAGRDAAPYDPPMGLGRQQLDRFFPWAMILFWAAFLAFGVAQGDWLASVAGALGTAAFAILLFARLFRPSVLYKPRVPTPPSRLDELEGRLVAREEIESSLAKGHRVRAIKLYRDATGATLAEALDGIERLEQRVSAPASAVPR